MSKYESQPSEGSALLNVFGSHVSLAELNGDVSSRANSRQPSRAPSPPPKPLTADTTKRARSRTITKNAAARGRPAVRHSLPLSRSAIVLRVLALYASGLIFAASVAHFVALGRLGPNLAASFPAALSPAIGAVGLFAVAIGVSFLLVDSYVRTEKHQRYDWTSFVRGTGAIFGLCYATTKIQSAWMFWGLANPIMWYVVDASAVGFIVSASLACTTAAVSEAMFGTSWHDTIVVAACCFSGAILWGNLARRLFA